jgi:predicted dehydrogenase
MHFLKFIKIGEMFDKEHKNFDAVSVATPDHNHAIQTLAAMQLGVYVQKPIAHDLYEAHFTKKYKVVTKWEIRVL